MRILQVVSLLSPDGAFGGPARAAMNQSLELARRGHDVTLAAGTRGYDPALRELGGVPVRLFGVRTVLPGMGFPGMAAPGLLRWFRRHAGAFDVVHIHFGRDLMVLPIAQTARRRIPYVLQTHGMVIPSGHPLSRPLDALFTRPILSSASAVLYLNERERTQLRAVAGDGLHLVEMPNGVPDYPPRVDTPARPPEILFLARLDPRKRPGLFIEMARLLLAGGLHARFALVGPDEGEGAAVRAMVGTDPRIVWEGPVPPQDVPARMSVASVYVLPAEREPYPMAVLEAMSVGVPVVVCDDCGLAPMVAETASGIVARPTAAALADAVVRILADVDGYGQRARETAQRRVGMADIGDRLLAVYRRAAA